MSEVTYDENGVPSDRNDPNAVPWTQRPVEYYSYQYPRDGSVFAPIAPEGTLLLKYTVEDDARLDNALMRMFGEFDKKREESKRSGTYNPEL